MTRATPPSFFFSLLAVVGLVASCLPDATGTSSSGGSTSSGGGVAVDGGGDGGTSDIPAARVTLCAQYAAATANCCNQGVGGTCATNNQADLNAYCIKYARQCTGMPTCFSGPDCNSLIYCGGSC